MKNKFFYRIEKKYEQCGAVFFDESKNNKKKYCSDAHTRLATIIRNKAAEKIKRDSKKFAIKVVFSLKGKPYMFCKCGEKFMRTRGEDQKKCLRCLYHPK